MKKKVFYKRPNFPVFIEQHFIPYGKPNRCGVQQIPKWIVIHEVSLGNGRSPEMFNMDYYKNKIILDGEKGSSIGYHFLVGDRKIYQFLKETECTSHTGTFDGNSESIGVERLICKGVNYQYALHNQAKLIATLMVKWEIPIDHVVTHSEMQNIFEPKEKNYVVYTSLDDCDFQLSTFVNELNMVTKLYNQVAASKLDNKQRIKLINIQSDLESMSKLEDVFNTYSLKAKKMKLYNLVDLHCRLNRLFCGVHNLEYHPIDREIEGLRFFEKLEVKKCPNRLLNGWYGGMNSFKNEIIRCLQFGWFFDELFELDKESSINTCLNMLRNF